jgi:hypothetical protein
MDKFAVQNLVPMSKEDCKLRGVKNIRRKNGFRQLLYVDGLGNIAILMGDENKSESFGNQAKKWPEYMERNLSIKYINQKRLENGL